MQKKNNERPSLIPQTFEGPNAPSQVAAPQVNVAPAAAPSPVAVSPEPKSSVGPVASAAPPPTKSNPVVAAPPSSSSGGPMPKLGKNFLKEIQAQATAAASNAVVKNLDLSLAQSLFNDYVTHLRVNEDKQLQASNLSTAKIEIREENVITIVCNSQMSEVYAIGNIEQLRDYCRNQTNNGAVLIQVDLAPEAERVETVNTRMSAAEVFGMYVAKNPALQRLRETLRLDVKLA